MAQAWRRILTAVLASGVLVLAGSGCGRIGYELTRAATGKHGVKNKNGQIADSGQPVSADASASPPVAMDAGDSGSVTVVDGGDAASACTGHCDAAVPDAGHPSDAGSDAEVTGCVLGGSSYAVGQAARLAGTLELTAVNSGKCAAVAGCASNRGPAAVQQTCDFTPCQLWDALDLGQGWFALRNAASGHCMDLSNSATSDGTAVVQWDCYFPTTQNFQAVCAGNDEWTLINRASGLPLSVQNALSTDGAALIESRDRGRPNQRFRIESQTDVFTPIVPTAEQGPGAVWRYRTTMPPSGWNGRTFDDSEWMQGAGGFGNRAGGQAVTHTAWSSSDIWLRTSFILTSPLPSPLSLRLFHDEDVEVYLNGEQAFSATAWQIGYMQADIKAAALATLVAGANELAVHCKNTSGPQFIDVGLGVYTWQHN